MSKKPVQNGQKKSIGTLLKKIYKWQGNIWKDTQHPHSVQFSSVAQSCLTLCDPMNRSTPGLPGQHQLLEFTQTHVHRVGDAIQPSHPLSSPSPPAPNPSQHQGLFQWVNSSHEVAKVLEFQLQLQHQSFQWTWEKCKSKPLEFQSGSRISNPCETTIYPLEKLKFKWLMIQSVDKKIEQLGLSYTGENAKWETTLETNLTVSYKVKHILIVWSSKPTWRSLPWENESKLQTKACR